MAPGLARVPERSSEWLTVSGEYREHSTYTHTWRQFVIYSSLQHQNKQYHLHRIGQLPAIIIWNLLFVLHLKLFCHYQPRCIMAVVDWKDHDELLSWIVLSLLSGPDELLSRMFQSLAVLRDAASPACLQSKVILRLPTGQSNPNPTSSSPPPTWSWFLDNL